MQYEYTYEKTQVENNEFGLRPLLLNNVTSLQLHLRDYTKAEKQKKLKQGKINDCKYSPLVHTFSPSVKIPSRTIYTDSQRRFLCSFQA
jgi:hypothetical protein